MDHVKRGEGPDTHSLAMVDFLVPYCFQLFSLRLLFIVTAKILRYVHGSSGKGSGYQLEGYPQIWVDADAFTWYVEQAGCTKLEWGLFGVMRQGRFQQDTKKIQDAIHDFQEILSLALRQSDALHPQLYGSTQLQLSRAQLALKHILSERGKGNALLL